MSNEYYLHNPLIHRDRRLGQSQTAWIRQFDCTHMRPLIICRGPIRKEAMDVFAEMGIEHFGILLSEKDSIVYRNALAPELRSLTDPDRVHRVPDYSGANKEEREARIRQIISIARDNSYNSIFAGYGFMAEDEMNMAPIQASMESPALAGIPINYQERRIWHLHEEIDRVIGTERIPPALRLQQVLGPYVEQR